MGSRSPGENIRARQDLRRVELLINRSSVGLRLHMVDMGRETEERTRRRDVTLEDLRKLKI